jgi:hypothetical protein
MSIYVGRIATLIQSNFQCSDEREHTWNVDIDNGRVGLARI